MKTFNDMDTTKQVQFMNELGVFLRDSVRAASSLAEKLGMSRKEVLMWMIDLLDTFIQIPFSLEDFEMNSFPMECAAMPLPIRGGDADMTDIDIYRAAEMMDVDPEQLRNMLKGGE